MWFTADQGSANQIILHPVNHGLGLAGFKICSLKNQTAHRHALEHAAKITIRHDLGCAYVCMFLRGAANCWQ
jgi:hypothetical protein